ARLQLLDLSRLAERACVCGVETVGAPPVDADGLGLVDRADDEAELDREQLDVRQRDLDVAGDDESFVEDLVEDVDQTLRLSLLNGHVRAKISQRLYRSELQVQIVVAQSEDALQLVHLLLELHEGVAETLDLLVGEIARIHPPQCLFFQKSPDQLDD